MRKHLEEFRYKQAGERLEVEKRDLEGLDTTKDNTGRDMTFS